MTEINEFSERWSEVQARLTKLAAQRDEIERQFNTAWDEQNELHKEGIIAGYELDRRSMTWSK